MDTRIDLYIRPTLDQTFPIIIPFNMDFVNSHAGQHIAYRTTRDYRTLIRVNQDISLTRGKSGYPSNFKTAEAIIVTYNRIPRYMHPNTKFTYQIIIATDYQNTFVILNYDRIDSNGDGIGISENGCVIDYILNRSNQQRELTWTSNVGRAGKHIFLMTQRHCKGCTFRFNYKILFY